MFIAKRIQPEQKKDKEELTLKDLYDAHQNMYDAYQNMILHTGDKPVKVIVSSDVYNALVKDVSHDPYMQLDVDKNGITKIFGIDVEVYHPQQYATEYYQNFTQHNDINLKWYHDMVRPYKYNTPTNTGKLTLNDTHAGKQKAADEAFEIDDADNCYEDTKAQLDTLINKGIKEAIKDLGF